jgi:hypothetical protein
MPGSLSVRKKNAAKVKQPSTGDYLRTAKDVLVVNPRNSAAATLGGAAYDYATKATDQKIRNDISKAGQDAYKWLRKENKALRDAPITETLRLLKAGYIDPLADPYRVFKQAATERARGNESGAKKLAAMVPLAVAGVVNPEFRGAGKLATKAGVEAAETAATKVATKTATKAAEKKAVKKATKTATNTPRFTAKQEGPFLRVNREGAKRQTVPEVREARNIDEIRAILQDPSKNIPAQAADEYTRATLGRGYDLNMPAPSTSLEKQSGIARVFQEAAEGSPEYKQRLFEAYGNAMPEVVEQAGAQNYDQLTEAAYRQLADETRAQFDTLPVQTSYHYGAGEYATPSDMLRDVLGEGNLNVFQGGEPHEFLGKVDPDTGLTANEMFRAAHDLYGHGTRGATFRPGGEELAYASHSQMMSPLAQLAMLSETRGQNSLVNYSPLNVKPIGEMRDILHQIAQEKTLLGYRGEKPRPGQFDAQNARLRELGGTFEYAPQKALLLPPEYLDVNTTGGVPEYLRDVIKARAPSAPERAVHLSHTEGLSATDPSFYGTGHRGEDFAVRGKRGSPSEQTSFYLGPEGTVIPEKVVEDISPFAYETELSGLYDIGSDPEGLVALARAYRPPVPNYPAVLGSPIPDFRRMVREYGYGGYRDVFGPQDAANVFDPVKLQRRIQKGPRGYAEGGTVEA